MHRELAKKTHTQKVFKTSKYAAQQISLIHDIEVWEQLLLMFICSWLAHVRTET